MKHGKSILALLLTLTCLAPLTAQSKPRLAVLPFTGGAEGEGNGLSILFANQKIIRDSYTVVPRNDTVIAAVMKEQDIQRQGLTDSDAISTLGKQLNADYVVVGHIQQLGDSSLVLITIVGVESMQQLAGDYRIYKDLAEIRAHLPNMAAKIINAPHAKNKPRLAVLPFDIPTGINQTDAEVLAQLLATEIANCGTYEVLPRTTAINRVMEEHAIQRSGLTDASSIRQIGTALNARYVLSGMAINLGSSTIFSAQILRVDTGELVNGSDEEYAAIADGVTVMTILAKRLTGGGVYMTGKTGPAGGIIFYDKGSYSEGWCYLEAAPPELEFQAAWGAYEKDVNGTGLAVGSGKRNTEIIVAYLKSIGETGKAAQLAVSTRFDGYTDWFLPSKDELNLMYKNLKAKGLGGFGDGWYWSSSQYGTYSAWDQRFSDGNQLNFGSTKNYDKRAALSVRVVRAF